MFKFKQIGNSGSLLKLLQNYLSNRIQCMFLNGSCSDYSGIESGVPRGSVLSPILFLARNIKSNFKFFANDTMLFSSVKYAEISADYI